MQPFAGFVKLDSNGRIVAFCLTSQFEVKGEQKTWLTIVDAEGEDEDGLLPTLYQQDIEKVKSLDSITRKLRETHPGLFRPVKKPKDNWHPERYRYK